MQRLVSRPRAIALAGVALAAALLPALPATVLAVGPVSHYVFAPSPIAAAGSLAANASVAVSVSAEDTTNALVPGAVIYLSFSQTTGGGSALVGTTALTSTPVAFTASTGKLTVTYKTPGVLPTGGKDIIKAANAKSLPTISASDLYSYSKVTKYTFVPNPIAVPGTLAANGTVNVVLTSYNSSSVAVPGATVYLSFKQATGGGSASVGTTLLTATPVAFKAGSTGQITITYKAPATLPTTGTDVITAQDAIKNQTLTRTDSYSFAGVHSYVFSPSPIAALGTLKAGQKVNVALTAKDILGNPVAGATVYLKFAPTTGGGTAMVGTKLLSATAAKFLTNSSGVITIVYTAPATLPASGTDTITAQNLLTAPTITASDGYTF